MRKNRLARALPHSIPGSRGEDKIAHNHTAPLQVPMRLAQDFAIGYEQICHKTIKDQ